MRLRSRYFLALLAGVVIVATVASAQDARPVLSETQRLQIANTLQTMEIAQLKAQAAQRDFDAALEQLRVLVAGLERPGYTLDMQTLTYRPVEAGKP